MKITKLPSGKYRTQLYDEFGKRQRKTFDRKADAEAFIGKIESNKHERRQIKHQLIKSRVSFEKAFSDFWQDKTGIRPKSKAKYIYEIEQFNVFRKSKGLTFIDEFTREHADMFRQVLIDTGAAPKTINSYLSQLKTLFALQLDRDNLTRDPTSHLKNIPSRRKTLLQREEDYYHEEEVRKFFIQDMEPEYKRALVGLFLTGMRFEELANLKWDRVDSNDRMIRLRSTDNFSTKTPSGERDIPISDKLHKILLYAGKQATSEYVFASISGNKLSERTLLAVCKRIAVKAVISKTATLHKFRHTFSSLLSQFGIAYEVREYLLGHKPLGSLTAHYTKFDPAKLHKTVSILDQFVEDI